mmetsp:Transcript_12572/g.29761  ORF Transcript_12572/g.29761 Transcript_12572/m.29761 type:complete len:211 (+) Transcript_12572:141-773(+)
MIISKKNGRGDMRSSYLQAMRNPDRETNTMEDFERDNSISGSRYSITVAKIHMHLMISLLFAVFPGVTQFPAVARSVVPSINSSTSTVGLPSIAIGPTVVGSSSSLDPDELLDRRRSMDAARLLLEDYSGKKRAKIPISVKKQMDMQDRRLALCQELSRDAWDWEQCFFFGSENGTSGAQFFDSRDFVESDSATKVATKAAATKTKVPTW